MPNASQPPARAVLAWLLHTTVALGGAACFDLEFEVGSGNGGTSASTGVPSSTVAGSGAGDSSSDGSGAEGGAGGGPSNTTTTSSSSSSTSTASWTSTSSSTGSGGGCADPTALSVSPARNDVGVALSAPIDVVFACELDPATATVDDVVAVGSLSGPIEGTVVLQSPSVLRFTPTQLYRFGEQITFTVTSDVTTSAGVPAPLTYAFTTTVSVPAPSRQLDAHEKLGGPAGTQVALGDLDDDGALDAFAAGDGADVLWLGDSIGGFDAVDQVIGDGLRTGVVLEDLDGDGDLDAFITRATHGQRDLAQRRVGQLIRRRAAARRGQRRPRDGRRRRRR